MATALHRAPEPTGGVVPVPKAPRGARVVGTTAGGDPIWEREVERVVRDEDGTPVKDPVLGPDGEEQWRKHPTTGESLYPKVRAVTETVTERFVLHIERNERGYATGQVRINRHYAADPEEERRIRTQEEADRIRRDFFARAAEMNLDADALLGALGTGTQTPETPDHAGHADPYEGVAYGALKKLAAEHDLGVGPTPKRTELVAALAEAGIPAPE